MPHSMKNCPSERRQLSCSTAAVAGIHDPHAGKITENSPQCGGRHGELSQGSRFETPDSAQALDRQDSACEHSKSCRLFLTERRKECHFETQVSSLKAFG